MAAKKIEAVKDDGAFGPSLDPKTPDFVWVPLDAKKARAAGFVAIRPWPDNPRVNARTVDGVAASLKEFGWVRPLVANTWPGLEGELIIGHTTRLAAIKLGLKVWPVRYRRMAPERAHAAALADNRLQEHSVWDLTKLADMAPKLGEPLFALAGWDAGQFKGLLAPINIIPPSDFREVTIDAKTDYTCPRCKYEWSGSTGKSSKAAAKADAKAKAGKPAQ